MADGRARVAASILDSDLSNLAHAVRRVQAAGVDRIHLDLALDWRVLAFTALVTFMPPDQVVTFDWTQVGRANLAFLEGAGASARWTTFVSSVDAITIVNVVVAAAGLMVMDRKLGAARATLAASVWPAAGIALRVLLAGILGLPLR